MGFPPPPDAPPPEVQDAADAAAEMPPSPTGPALCGFSLVPPGFSIPFPPPIPIPSIPLPTLPTFDFFVALNCSLADPIDAGFGGGRVGQTDVDADDELA